MKAKGHDNINPKADYLYYHRGKTKLCLGTIFLNLLQTCSTYNSQFLILQLALDSIKTDFYMTLIMNRFHAPQFPFT